MEWQMIISKWYGFNLLTKRKTSDLFSEMSSPSNSPVKSSITPYESVKRLVAFKDIPIINALPIPGEWLSINLANIDWYPQQRWPTCSCQSSRDVTGSRSTTVTGGGHYDFDSRNILQRTMPCSTVSYGLLSLNGAQVKRMTNVQ